MEFDFRVIIISYNCKKYTEECINSIYSEFANAKISVIDNNSNDGTQEFIKDKFPNVLLIENSENLGYAKAINLGAKHSMEKYLLLSNADVIYKSGSIKALLTELQRHSLLAAVSPLQFYPNGKLQPSSGYLPSLKYAFINFLLLNPIINKFQKILTVTKDYLDGAVIAVKKDIFDRIHGFDENFFFYSEDADFCYRLKTAGYNFSVIKNAEVIHHRGASTNINGINLDSLQLFVKAKIKLSKKINTRTTTNLYIISEFFNTKLFSIIFLLISKFPSKSNRFNYKSSYYSSLSSIWKTHIK